MVVAVLGLGFFVTRFFFGPEAAFIRGRPSATAMFLSSLSWAGLAMLLGVCLFGFATWYGQRSAERDRGKLAPPLHYGWFIGLGLIATLGAAAGVVWAVRSGILINSFELFAAGMAAVLVIVLALFFQRTRVGRALRAVADDHAAAQSVGISLRGIWVIVWAVAGIVALAAGIIWGGKSGVQFSLSLIALKALPVLISGASLDPGAIVGGLIIGVAKVAEVSQSVGGAYRELVCLHAGPAVPAGASAGAVRREDHRASLGNEGKCSIAKPASSRPATPPTRRSSRSCRIAGSWASCCSPPTSCRRRSWASTGSTPS
jgi:branched-subunit amino acid ABC-type transport system permease component